MCGLVFGSGFVIMLLALSNLTIMGGSRKFRQWAGVPDNEGHTNLNCFSRGVRNNTSYIF